MVFFDQNEFINKYNNGVPQILSSKLIADTETPVSTLLKISTNQKYSFLLESVEGGDQRGRYSLLGCDPDLIWQVKKGKIFVKTNDKVLNEKINEFVDTGIKERVHNEVNSIIEKMVSSKK